MFLFHLLTPALRVVTCSLLVLSTGATVWAQVPHARCDMQQAGTKEHHCGGTKVQACDCDDITSPAPLPIAKVTGAESAASDAATVRIVHPIAPISRLAVAVPSRGLRHAPIPILHATLLL